jgi:hypothetical protein
VRPRPLCVCVCVRACVRARAVVRRMRPCVRLRYPIVCRVIRFFLFCPIPSDRLSFPSECEATACVEQQTCRGSALTADRCVELQTYRGSALTADRCVEQQTCRGPALTADRCVEQH